MPNESSDAPTEESFGVTLRRTRSAICSTCSRWRSIAIEDQLLWNNIVMAYRRAQYNKPQLRSPHPSLIPLELSRAGSRLLSIFLRFYGGSDWTPMSPVIAPALPRCRNLFIDVTLGAELGVLSDPTNLKKMRALVLKWSGTGSSNMPANKPEVIDFTQSKHMHDLWITWAHESRQLMLETPDSFTSITRLHLEGVSTAIAAQLINSCSNLQILHWESPRRNTPDLARLTSIQSLPHLHSLYVDGAVPFASIGELSAPSLTYLKINHSIPHTDYVWKTRTHVFANANRFEGLRMLDIAGTTPKDTLASFLVTHTKLEALIFDFALDAYWLDCLNRSSSSSGFQLSNLRILWTRGMAPDGSGAYNLSPARRLLAARAQMGNPRRAFEMVLYGWDMAKDDGARELVRRYEGAGRGRVKVRLNNAEFDDPIWRWDEKVF